MEPPTRTHHPKPQGAGTGPMLSNEEEVNGARSRTQRARGRRGGEEL